MNTIKVIIPTFNKENAIAKIIGEVPKSHNDTIVVSNNTTDKIKEVAKKAKAILISETKKGYTYTYLKGIEYITNQMTKPHLIAFLNDYYPNYPKELSKLIAWLVDQNINFCHLSSRLKFT